MSEERDIYPPHSAEDMSPQVGSRPPVCSYEDFHFTRLAPLPLETGISRHFGTPESSGYNADVAKKAASSQSLAEDAEDSAPVSPGTQTHAAQEDELEEELESGDDEREPPREKTAAERLAEKRRMKRFRLTHNQTRYLMSEFARQPHPDAAQRYRLSKEIPGLSPRQVQVWFQNRRAKLKRLTTEGDRESILRSRALPEDFDTANILHSGQTSGFPPPPGTTLDAGYSVTPEPGQHYTYGQPSQPESAPSALGIFPPNTSMVPDPLSVVSPASDPVLTGGYKSPEGPHRPRSSSSTVPRQRRIARIQTEGLEQPERVASPTFSFTGNLDYAAIDPGAEMSPARQRAYSAYVPSPEMRSQGRMSMPFARHQQYNFPQLEQLQQQEQSAPGGALPPTPESSTASMVLPGSAPLPSTLLAFSRMHDQSTFPSGFPSFAVSAVEAHPTPADSHPESLTPAAGPTPGSLPSGESYLAPEGRQHDPSHSGPTPTSSTTAPYEFPHMPPTSMPFGESQDMPYSPEAGVALVQPYSSRHGSIAGRNVPPPGVGVSVPGAGYGTIMPQSQVQDEWAFAQPTHEGFTHGQSESRSQQQHGYPYGQMQSLQQEPFDLGSEPQIGLQEQYPYVRQEQRSGYPSSHAPHHQGQAEFYGYARPLPRQRPSQQLYPQEPRITPRRSQQLYPGDPQPPPPPPQQPYQPPITPQRPYHPPLTPQQQYPYSQPGSGTGQQAYYAPSSQHEHTPQAVAPLTPGSSGKKRQRDEEEEKGDPETSKQKRRATMPRPGEG